MKVEIKDFKNQQLTGCTHQARCLNGEDVCASAVIVRNSSWDLEAVIGGSLEGMEMIRIAIKEARIAVKDWEVDTGEQPLADNGGQFDDGKRWA